MNSVDQVVDGRHAVLFCDIGDMGIPCGGVWTGMAEKSLNMTKAQAFFKEVRGKAVSK